jgi:transposase
MRRTGMSVESPMRGNVHVRFGRRLGETDRLRGRNRAPCRPTSQIQALDRTQPSLPMKSGRAGTLTHDYKRNGTTTLFAALDVLTGSVIGQCLPRHRHSEFLKFLQTIDREVPHGLKVHLMLDNYATHDHPKIREWLAKHPRFELHFTPTSSSWLNMVEIFFGRLRDEAIRRGVFNSVPDLIDAIEAYLAAHNNPQPFKWTASTDQVLEKVRRGRVTLDASTS